MLHCLVRTFDGCGCLYKIIQTATAINYTNSHSHLLCFFCLQQIVQQKQAQKVCFLLMQQWNQVVDSLASCAALYVHNAQRILLALDQGSCKTLADLPWTKASTKKAHHCTHVLSNMGATKGVSLEHGLHPITIKNCFKKKTLFFFCTDFLDRLFWKFYTSNKIIN